MAPKIHTEKYQSQYSKEMCLLKENFGVDDLITITEDEAEKFYRILDNIMKQRNFNKYKWKTSDERAQRERSQMMV